MGWDDSTGDKCGGSVDSVPSRMYLLRVWTR